jgi:hypothetical protein
MLSVNRYLLRKLLPDLLRRACNETVHRSGAEGERTNCFVTTLAKDGRRFMLLRRVEGAKISGLEFDGQRYSIPASILFADVDPGSLRVTHYYGLDEVRYVGVGDLALGRLTGLPYARIHLVRLKNDIAQRAFNRRTLEVRRRLDILRDVIEEVTRGSEAVDAMDLMSRRYGARWASHPDWDAHHRLLELHLDLLADSGELRKVNHRFQPTGMALKTLEESEEEDRKHSANLRVQVLLAILTFVSAVMAGAQAGLVKLPTVLDLTTSGHPASSPSPSVQASAAVSPPVPSSIASTPGASRQLRVETKGAAPGGAQASVSKASSAAQGPTGTVPR